MAKKLALYCIEENVIQVKLIKFKEISNGMNYKFLLTIEGSPNMYVDVYFSLAEVSDLWLRKRKKIRNNIKHSS